MSITDRLDEIEQRANAATEGPWEWGGTPPRPRLRQVDRPHSGEVLGCSALLGPAEGDATFIAHARTDVPALVAALRAVLKPHMTQPPEWLGDKQTFDGEDAEEPGNDAYMDYIERVLTAAGFTDIPWGPVLLAITLDRLVREAEKSVAITEALGGTP